MTRRIDMGGRQGRGDPEVGHEDREHGDLSGPRGALFWALVAWVVVLLAAFVLPDALAYLLSLVIGDAAPVDCVRRACT